MSAAPISAPFRLASAGALLAAALLAGGCDSSKPSEPAPTAAAVRVAADSVRLFTGEGAVIAASAVDARGNPVPGAALAWSSSDTAVAVVDPAGHVLGVRPGTATVSVSLVGGSGGRASVAVRVEPHPDRLEIPDTVVLRAPGSGCSIPVVAVLYDRAGNPVERVSTPLVGFTVRDTSVADRDPNYRGGGTSALVSIVLAGKRAGETRLIASAAGYQDTAVVRVGAGTPTRLGITPFAPYPVAVGDTLRFSGRVYNECGGAMPQLPTFSSGRPAVGEVSPDGRLVARAAGHALVRASWGSLADSVYVTVNEYRLLPADTTVFVGDTVVYRAFVADSTGVFRPFTGAFATSDSAVARVAGSGQGSEQPVLAVGAGEARVSVHVFAGATARLRVVKRP